MTCRFGAVAVVGLGLLLGGCGGGAAASAGGPQPQAYDLDDLPAWIQELPEGEPPRDNSYTAQAALFLVQASQAEGEQARTRYQAALQAAEEGMEEDPTNAQSYFQAGEALLGLGRYDDGAAMLDRAEEIYPRYVIETDIVRESAWIDLYNEGIEHIEAGNQAGAMDAFAGAHTVYQGRPEAMLQLTVHYSEQGRVEEAIDLYEQILGLIRGPRVEELDEEMRADWEEFWEIAVFNLAQLLFQEERYEEAAAQYESVLDEDPDNMLALSNLAIAYVSAGRPQQARAIYDDLMNRPGLNARDYFTIGVGLYQADEMEQSARAFRLAWDEAPGHRDAGFNLAQVLFLDAKWEELLEATQELLEIDSHNPNAYRFRAQALVNLERQQEAVQVLEVAEDLPFEVETLQLQQAGQNVVLVGEIFNKNEPVGSTARLRLFFYDPTGAELGTEVIEVELGEPDEGVVFQADYSGDGDIFGFRYEVL